MELDKVKHINNMIVMSESYRESTAVVLRIWEFIFLEIEKFNILIKSFIKIDTIKIDNNIQLKNISSFTNILLKEDFKKDIPTKIIKNEIIKAEIYSYLP